MTSKVLLPFAAAYLLWLVLRVSSSINKSAKGPAPSVGSAMLLRRQTPAVSVLPLRLGAGHFESPRKARVIIDGREEYEVEFPDDGLSPALLEFEKTQKIRRVEIHLLERTDVGKKRTGLSEVTLLGRESRSRRRR